ncbi:MAG: translation initiation factor IF-2 [Patescibacteria group bacterium]|jgi:translation initiation factor IF-2|nr:translation initiation factor IF-2 [Patescibacteria group bacterium]
MAEKTNQVNMVKRPPIVVVMGHIDHGKTTLLDTIRKTNITAKEAGGITQHIGAYDIIVKSDNPEYNNRQITFIDTPGHEAFSAIRARGAQVCDIAILIIAADEGVKPQTIEALNHIQQAKIPFIVALNKIDRAEANPDKVKTQLAELGVFVEGWGGNVPIVNISAKNGTNINELLELILLVADMEDLKAELNIPASGVILETKFDNKRGIIASVLIKNGVLKVGDSIYTETVLGKVRLMEDCNGKQIKEAGPSKPVLIIGFKDMPQVGEEFFVGEKSEEELKKMRENKRVEIQKLDASENVLNIILKADVVGSLEAMKNILNNLTLPENTSLKIISESIGDIFVSDVSLAETAPAIILGFRVKIPKDLQTIIQAKNLRVYLFDVIYEMEKFLKEEIEAMFKPQEPPIKGKLEILACFSKKRTEQVVGGKVIEGRIVKGAQVKIQRGEEIIGRGKILNVQCNKLDVKEVLEGKECGILIDSDVEIIVGDQLIFQ